MNSPSYFQKSQNAWRQLSKRRKILAGCIVISCIVGGWFILYLVDLSQRSWNGEPPRLSTGLRITEEGVYSNGTVSFTVFCEVESYKNFPIPEGDIYRIEKAFICVEDDLTEFNSTLGEIKHISEVTVIEGDFTLGAYEEVSLKFQTSFALHNVSHVYIGVLAVRASSQNGVVVRWDLYTSIIP